MIIPISSGSPHNAHKCGRAAFSHRRAINQTRVPVRGLELHFTSAQAAGGGTGAQGHPERFWLLKLKRHHFSYPRQTTAAKKPNK